MIDIAFALFPTDREGKTFFYASFEKLKECKIYKKDVANYTFKNRIFNGKKQLARSENYSIAGLLNLPE